MRKTIIICFCLFTFYNAGYSQTSLFDSLKKHEVIELKADFEQLRTHLEKYHAGLYWHTKKTEFDRFFDSVSLSIDREMNDVEFFKIVSQVIEKTHERHTRYGLSAIDTSSNVLKIFREAKIFPFALAFLNNKAYIYANLSTDTILQRGAELVSINQRTIEDLSTEMFKYIVADGFNESSKYRDLDKHFETYYYWYIAQPDTFNLEYIDQNGANKTLKVSALPIDTMDIIAEKRYWKEMLQKDTISIVGLDVDKETDIAFLRIESFRDRDFKDEGIDYRTFVENSFQELKESKVKNLVIDLRNNQGGKISYMYYLLAYLLDSDNRVVLMKTAKSPTDSARKAIKSPKLDPNYFKGDIYILAEARTYSAASMLTSILKYFRKAKVVGLETGGGFYGTTAGFFKSIQLTHTKIKVEIPLIRYELNVEGQEKGRGVFPDYEVLYSKESLTEDKDDQKEFIIELIRKKTGR